MNIKKKTKINRKNLVIKKVKDCNFPPYIIHSF